MKSVRIGKIPFSALTLAEAEERVAYFIQETRDCHQVVVANSYSTYLAEQDSVFAGICENADLVFPDGLPIVLASKLKKERLPSRVAGPDFMWSFSRVCASRGFRVFFLGSREQDLANIKRNFERSFPKINIVGTYSPPFGDWDAKENNKMIQLINSSKADILWLGVSTPKQDKWISSHKKVLKVKVAIAVGAAFDFHSGRVKRAPIAMQKLCLEWFYRFLQEPRRMWKKYLVSNFYFIKIVARDLVKRKT
jgi:N-acetylglucosaminyldiphosphoundecaprenol N-acetyl-beta-D-mannosaminyltransferase